MKNTIITASLTIVSALITLANPVNSQEYINISGFEKIQQGVKATSTRSESEYVEEKVTTADLRFQWCLNNEREFNAAHSEGIIGAKVAFGNSESRTAEAMARVSRKAIAFDDAYKTLVRRCNSNSATMGRTQTAYKKFRQAAKSLNNEIGVFE